MPKDRFHDQADEPDDELDAQLRGAMAALDRATPAARFDDLFERAMARVEDPSIGELPVLRVADGPEDGDAPREDSGLTDIRALASETKARLASRRSSQDLTRAADELAAAASSASWKAVAMPEPARVVEVAAPVAPPRRRRWLAGGLGVGLAAAAGLVIFVSTQRSSSERVAAHSPPAPDLAFPPEPTAVPHDPAPPAVVPAPVHTDDHLNRKPGRTAVATKPLPQVTKATGKKREVEDLVDEPVADPVADPRPDAVPPAPVAPGATAGSGRVADPVETALHAKAPPKRTLARTSLSTDDIQRGMAAVEPRARACFAGTAGLASVRLAVAPSGQVTAVTVTGPFAGTPVGACVDRAARAAAFPAWDGAPQSFNYSYLLSD